MAAALDASARAADCPHGPGRCSPPKCWPEGEGGEAAERRPTGTEDRRQGREVEEQATHTGLLAQKTPPPGERPGILAEPGPQRSDRSRRHSSGDCLPTLGLPVLTGASAEQVDSSSLRFLTAAALRRRKEEEEKRLRRRPRSRRRSRRTKCSSKPLLRWSKRDSFSSATRGRGKRGGRGVFLGPLLSPRMAMLVVDIGSGMFLAGFLLRSSAGLSFQALWLVWT